MPIRVVVFPENKDIDAKQVGIWLRLKSSDIVVLAGRSNQIQVQKSVVPHTV